MIRGPLTTTYYLVSKPTSNLTPFSKFHSLDRLIHPLRIQTFLFTSGLWGIDVNYLNYI